MGNMAKEEARRAGKHVTRHAYRGKDIVSNGYPVPALRGFCAVWAAMWAFTLVWGLWTGAI